LKDLVKNIASHKSETAVSSQKRAPTAIHYPGAVTYRKAGTQNVQSWMTDPIFTEDRRQMYKANQEPFQGENENWLQDIFVKALGIFKEGRTRRARMSKSSDADADDEEER